MATKISKRFLGLVSVVTCVGLLSPYSILASGYDVGADDRVIDTSHIPNFVYADENGLGTAGDFAVFSMNYTNSSHMEGTIATKNLNSTGNGFGITGNVVNACTAGNYYHYIENITTSNLMTFEHNYPSNQYFSMVLPSDSTFSSYNNGSGVRVNLNGSSIIKANQVADVVGSDANALQRLLKVSDLSEAQQINFERAMASLEVVSEGISDLVEEKSFEPTQSVTASDIVYGDGITASFNSSNAKNASYLNVNLAAGQTNVVNLNLTALKSGTSSNLKINFIGATTAGTTVIINVVDIPESYYDSNTKTTISNACEFGNSGAILFDGKALTDGTYSVGTNALINFGDYSGTINLGAGLQDGVILAPNATVKVTTTHHGNIMANSIDNVGGEIHQGRFLGTIPTLSELVLPTLTPTTVTTATPTESVATATPTESAETTPTSGAEATAAPTESAETTPTSGAEATAAPTESAETTPTESATATPTGSATPVTATPVPTATATPVPTATATPVPTATATPVPTATATPVPTATATPVPTATATPVPTATATPVPTATATPVPTATATPVPTATATPVPTATATPVPTATPTPVPTATPTPTPITNSIEIVSSFEGGTVSTPDTFVICKADDTEVDTLTTGRELQHYEYTTTLPEGSYYIKETSTPDGYDPCSNIQLTVSADGKITVTDSTYVVTTDNGTNNVSIAVNHQKTPVPTATATPVPTATATPVPTATATPVPTATATPVPTATATPVPTATATPVPTATATPVPTATATPVPTATATPVPTATATPVPTATATPVPTATPTPTPITNSIEVVSSFEGGTVSTPDTFVICKADDTEVDTLTTGRELQHYEYTTTLPEGSYYIKETSTPDGYDPCSNIQLTVSADGKITVTDSTYVVTTDNGTNNVSIAVNHQKTSVATATPTGSATPVTATATPTGSATPATGTATPTESATPATGTATPTESATPATGTATPTESATPVTATPTGSATPVTTTPTPITNSIEIVSSFEGGTVSTPDTFVICKADDTEVDTLTTGRELQHYEYTTTLPEGSYYIKETSTPDGYDPCSNIQLTVSADGKITVTDSTYVVTTDNGTNNVSIAVNHQKTSVPTATPTGSATPVTATATPTESATPVTTTPTPITNSIEVVSSFEGGTVSTPDTFVICKADDTEVDTLTTGRELQHYEYTTTLPEGSYYIKETSTPDGYDPCSNIQLTVSADGKITVTDSTYVVTTDNGTNNVSIAVNHQKTSVPTATPTGSATPVTATATPTGSATPATATATPTGSATPATGTATPTESATPVTATATPTGSATPATATATPTGSATPATGTATPTESATPVTATATPTGSATPVNPTTDPAAPTDPATPVTATPTTSGSAVDDPVTTPTTVSDPPAETTAAGSSTTTAATATPTPTEVVTVSSVIVDGSTLSTSKYVVNPDNTITFVGGAIDEGRHNVTIIFSDGTTKVVSIVVAADGAISETSVVQTGEGYSATGIIAIMMLAGAALLTVPVVLKRRKSEED